MCRTTPPRTATPRPRRWPTLSARQLQRAVPGLGETLITSLLEAIRATKKVRIQRDCGKCGCNHIQNVEVQDSIAATNAIRLLIEQVEGRPGVASGEEREPIIVQRTVYATVSAEQALALLDAGELDQLRAELQSSLPVPTRPPPFTQHAAA